MKKLFGLLFIAIALTACSKDDDNNNTSVSIEGNWKLTAFETENAYDLNNDGIPSKSVMDETNCYQNEIVNFKADGTGSAISSSYADIELTLVIGTTDEYEYVINCIPEIDVTSFTYTQNGTNVTMTVEGETVIATLSGNTFTYVIQDGFFIDVDDEGNTITLTEDLTFVYTKQ